MTYENCIYCREAFDSEGLKRATQEHVVPRSLGGSGWITTRAVCKECNDYFGDHVDIVCNFAPVWALCREANLSPGYRLEGTYINRALGRIVRGKITGADGNLIDMEHVHWDGDRVAITHDDPKRVLEIARGLSRSSESRGRPLEFSPLIEIESEPRVIVQVSTPEQARNFHDILRREAAKIVIGYLSARYGAEIALRPELDDLRAFSRSALGDPGVVRAPGVGGELVWLPRTQMAHGYGTSQTSGWGTPREAEKLREYLQSHGSPPPGIPTFNKLYHMITVFVDRETGPRCDVILFGRIPVVCPVPSDLPIRWGRVDGLAFNPRREYVRSH